MPAPTIRTSNVSVAIDVAVSFMGIVLRRWDISSKRGEGMPICAGENREAAMARYDSILGTVGNTPVVRVNRLAPDGVNLFVKVEAFNPLGSVKDRLALGVIE